jgi:hypothetical protein
LLFFNIFINNHHHHHQHHHRKLYNQFVVMLTIKNLCLQLTNESKGKRDTEQVHRRVEERFRNERKF